MWGQGGISFHIICHPCQRWDASQWDTYHWRIFWTWGLIKSSISPSLNQRIHLKYGKCGSLTTWRCLNGRLFLWECFQPLFDLDPASSACLWIVPVTLQYLCHLFIRISAGGHGASDRHSDQVRVPHSNKISQVGPVSKNIGKLWVYYTAEQLVLMLFYTKLL